MNMEVERFILTRGLPKTGQVVSYGDYDDGYYQAGWWLGRTFANNKSRFIAKTIGGDDVVIDRATGLTWVADGLSKGANWNNAMDFANAIAFADWLDFAGFTDWRLPNIIELTSLIKFDTCAPAIDTNFFSNIALNYYGSSTTRSSPTTDSWVIDFAFGLVSPRTKGGSNKVLCVRGGL